LVVARTPETINRDVGDQSKGPRLQKLRAVNLLLDTLERQEQAVAYCAVEFEGDVYLKEATKAGSTEYHEEDKNYDTRASFTIASPPVINTLVIFADCWIGKFCNRDVLFGFYAPNDITKERVSDRSQRLSVEWPPKPVLELLRAMDFSDSKTLECVKRFVLDEYASQYTDTEMNDGTGGTELKESRGNFAILDSWNDDDWKGFLGQITWQFGQEDHAQLEQSLTQRIRRSKHYNHGMSGKEGYIISHMCDLLDKRQSIPDPSMRFIHVAELELIFLRVGSGTHRLPDPAWKMWKSLPKPMDTRNLADKVLAVCKTATSSEIGRWSRKASNSMNLQREFEEDITLRSLKYQVYDACEDKLEQLRCENGGTPLTAEQLLTWIAVLVECCEERLRDCSRQFSYTFTSKACLAEMVWELVDSCYLAFDWSAA
jgi:hypothetical protein